MKIYELCYDNDEVYHTVGYFSDFEKAKEQLKVENIQNIQNILNQLPAYQEDADTQRFEIYEQYLDEVRDCHYKEKYFVEFSSIYNEEKDEYFYEIVDETPDKSKPSNL